jgi:hypothetical protein
MCSIMMSWSMVHWNVYQLRQPCERPRERGPVVEGYAHTHPPPWQETRRREGRGTARVHTHVCIYIKQANTMGGRTATPSVAAVAAESRHVAATTKLHIVCF